MHERPAWPEPGWHPKPGEPLSVEPGEPLGMQYWDGSQWSVGGPVGPEIEDSLYWCDVVLRKSNQEVKSRAPGATGWVIWNGPSSDGVHFLAVVLWAESVDDFAETGTLVFGFDEFDLFWQTSDGDLVQFEPPKPKSVAGKLLGGVARIIGSAPQSIAAPEYVPQLVQDRLRYYAADEPIADEPLQVASMAEPSTYRPPPGAESAESIVDRLRQLKALHDEGILTTDEYERKRKVLSDLL